jgi:hypothetical protein
MRTVPNIELEAAVAFLRLRLALYIPTPPVDIAGLVRSFAGPDKPVTEIPQERRLEFLRALDAATAR